MYYVYILKSLKDNNIYTGYTSNLKLRMEEHQAGQVKSTKDRHPLKLIYFEAYSSKEDAQKREIYLKSGGKAKNDLKNQIADSLTI